MMFGGFRSRWTTPASWAACMPAAICRANRIVRETDSFSSRRSTVDRSSPLMNGIVMNLMPLIVPRSWMRTTFLCVTWRAGDQSRAPGDSLVRHLAREIDLLLESLFGFGARAMPRVGADHFEGDGDAELRVPGLVDRAHATDAEQLDDVIALAEGLSHCKRRFRRRES